MNFDISFASPNLMGIFTIVLALSLGFTFFTQFYAVLLIQEFNFTEKNIGLLFGWIGIWLALTQGLMAAGANVKDIGLALSPMAYYAQFALDVPSVAMVTASHNENGWSGVKMGCARPLTFGPDEMGKLRDIVLNADFDA